MSRTVVVQEWIAAHGGSENVAEEMAHALDADVFTLRPEDPERFADLNVRESVLAKAPFLHRHKAAALPLMPSVWRHVDLSAYDDVVVSTHLFAHHVGSAPSTRGARVFVYVHTPGRYLWSPEFDHRGQARWVRAAAAPLRALDRRRVPQQASFAANSEFVRQRTRQAWGVDPIVIPPPVAVRAIQAGMPWSSRWQDVRPTCSLGCPAVSCSVPHGS